MRSLVKILAFILLFFIHKNNNASCIPNGTTVTLSSQVQVDSFPLNYAGCSVIDGTLIISGNDIVNLDSLIYLRRLNNIFIIVDNKNLISLKGLDSINIVGDLHINNNPLLLNLKGLSSIDTIFGFYVRNNNSLLDFAGLNVIKCITALYINDNSSLINLHGLEILTSLGEIYIDRNNSLINLIGLDNLVTLYSCDISDNPSLVNFYGLHNLVKIYSDLSLYNNSSILNLAGFSSLRSTGLFIIQNNLKLKNLVGLNNIDTVLDLIIQINPSLINLQGLESLACIINNGNGISIYSNPSLCSINEINSNIRFIPGNPSRIAISGNTKLSCCNIVNTLTSKINFDDILIENNAPGCNDTTEIRRTINNQNCCSTKYTYLKDTLCQGQNIAFNNYTLNISGTYYDTITVNSIDSIIILDLTVLPRYYQIINKNFCIGQSFTLSNGKIITTNGIYNDTIPNRCDSILEYHLNFLNNIASNQNISICKGKTYILPKGNTVNTTGVYRDTLRSSFGCDSIIITNLSVTNPIPVNNNVSICSGKSYTLPNGNVVNNAGVYYDTIRIPNACDSVIITHLSVIPYLQSTQIVEPCLGKEYTLISGKKVTQNGIYIDTVRNNQDCDSIITTHLTFFPPTPVNVSVSVCDGQTYVLPNGSKVKAAGTYVDTIKNINTCDSVIITNLSVLLNNFIVSLNATDTVESGNSIILQPAYIGGIATSWNWMPADNLSCTSCETPTVTPVLTTQYTVNTKSTDGCEDTAQTKIVVRQANVYVPQAFTPNNDGVNDLVEIFVMNPKFFSVKIFNRWGELVFESNDVNNKWNGTYNGENCPQDSYSYILDVTLLNDKHYHKQSSILLLR